MKRLLFIATFILLNRMAFAQWSVGVHGGVTSTHIDRSQAGRIDENYYPLLGYDFGVTGNYSFNSWFVWMSIIKSLVFAFIIASVSSFCGYTVEGGSVEVGKASTSAVVNSSILILFADVFLTQLLS